MKNDELSFLKKRLKQKPAKWTGTPLMKCKHQFFETCKIDPNRYTSDMMYIQQDIKGWGVHIVCAFCGERREVYSDGTIKIL